MTHQEWEPISPHVTEPGLTCAAELDRMIFADEPGSNGPDLVYGARYWNYVNS
jgi:hypothetical protein